MAAIGVGKGPTRDGTKVDDGALIRTGMMVLNDVWWYPAGLA